LRQLKKAGGSELKHVGTERVEIKQHFAALMVVVCSQLFHWTLEAGHSVRWLVHQAFISRLFCWWI
jgi:hypothetical protein